MRRIHPPIPLILALSLLLVVACAKRIEPGASAGPAGEAVEPAPPPPPPARERTATTAWESAPVLEHIEMPEYPAEARADSIEGWVLLKLIIDEEGAVTAAEVVTSEPPVIFDEAAIAAVMKWSYRPATYHGEPIKVQIAQRVEFTLTRRPPPAEPRRPTPPGTPPPPAAQMRQLHLPDVPGQHRIHLAWETAPVLLHLVRPEYPVDARADSVEGRVLMTIVIDEGGDVVDTDIILSQPPVIFDAAAVAAVNQWRFAPATLHGEPIRVMIAHNVEFTLRERSVVAPPPMIELPAISAVPPPAVPPSPPAGPPPAPTRPPAPPPPRSRVVEESPIFLAWETPPEVIHLARLEYPAAALADSVEGWVLVTMVIDEQGRVVSAEVADSEPAGIFDAAAVDVVMKSRWRPALQRNLPIKVRFAQRVEFILPER